MIVICQRPYSIRTRIKTYRFVTICAWLFSQRPYSIRTRIKTKRMTNLNYRTCVRDHIPLEQGLRRLCDGLFDEGHGVRDHIPLEQGLRLLSSASQVSLHCQRPYSIRTRIKTQSASAWPCPDETGQRPYSIRTRIKTQPGWIVHSGSNTSETIFH